MHRLFLLRHAKTETFAPSGLDRDRRLEPRGLTDASVMGKWLRPRLPRPAKVIVSPAVRTQQTWDILVTELGDDGLNVSHESAMYGAEITDLLDVIRGACDTDEKNLLLIGHNPGLHELALALLGNETSLGQLVDNLPTSGIVVIDLPINDWSEISFREGKLIQFVTPRLLREGTST